MRTQPSNSESLHQNSLEAEADTPNRPELVAAWVKTYNRPPPKRTSNRLLILSYHYHQQAALLGGLSKRALRQLGVWANGDGSFKGDRKSNGVVPAAEPGTRLIREWNGKTHVVDIDDDTILYRGETYTSLSAVARAITGARWSGPRFFGIAGK